MSTWRARQEGHGAVEVDGEAALDLVEDDAFDLLVGLEGLFELDPALLAARLVARDDRLAERVLDALEIDLDLVADLDAAFAARAREFLERDAAFGLEADIDDGEILLDRDDGALDDGALGHVVGAEALVEQGREILARHFSCLQCHTVSLAPAVGVDHGSRHAARIASGDPRRRALAHGGSDRPAHGPQGGNIGSSRLGRPARFSRKQGAEEALARPCRRYRMRTFSHGVPRRPLP